MTREDILDAAIRLFDEGGGQGLTMRSLASRLDVTPMSLYRHIVDHAGLLVALAERVYGEVLCEQGMSASPGAEMKALLTRYHDAVGRHPQLTLAIFAEPAAFAGVTRLITDRLASLLTTVTADHLLWRDILVDHAHGSGLALVSARDNPERAILLREQYVRALECLLARLERE